MLIAIFILLCIVFLPVLLQAAVAIFVCALVLLGLFLVVAAGTWLIATPEGWVISIMGVVGFCLYTYSAEKNKSNVDYKPFKQ